MAKSNYQREPMQRIFVARREGVPDGTPEQEVRMDLDDARRPEVAQLFWDQARKVHQNLSTYLLNQGVEFLRMLCELSDADERELDAYNEWLCEELRSMGVDPNEPWEAPPTLHAKQ